jgi:hypothetical protein
LLPWAVVCLFEACCRPSLGLITGKGLRHTPMVEEGLPGGLFDSAEEGDAEAVAAWLDDGGGVDARCAEHGDVTLLMAAAIGGQEAMVRMLLRRGASVNLQESRVGGTALMGAALQGHTTTVQALLDAKADASLLNISGGTALTMAEHQKQTATAQLLRQHAKRQAVEAEDRAAAAKAAHAEAAADAMAAELLGEEAEEKEAAAKKGKGKMKKARAPSTAAAESAAAAPLAGPPKTAAAQEELPDEPLT